MPIAGSVAYETEGGDKSPDLILTLYDFEEDDDPADHPVPLDPSPTPAPNPPPKKKRRWKDGNIFRNKPRGKQQGTTTIPVSPNNQKQKLH